MIVRLLLAASAAAICITSAVAQSSILPSTALMRDMGGVVYRDFNRMVRGEEPFDQAKVQAGMNRLVEDAKKMKAAFPETSKGKFSAESRFSSSPKVWEDKAGFDAVADRLVKVAEENRDKATSLDGLKAVNTAINAACNACHDGFRLRRN